MKYSVSIDVPDLAQGIAFYTGVFGAEEVARPFETYAVLRGSGGQRFGIIQKPQGSKPAPGTDDRRHFTRHWTPVHMDIEVDDFDATLDCLTALGGTVEHRFDIENRPKTAFCADPFGNGFCLMETRG
ncbi:MAG: VOC family protein [Pseudomonadota bacterium]|nr:VOC family protein [Pseudomonadota bacterium]